MLSLKEMGNELKAVVEWAKGSPLAQESVERLHQSDRMKMAELLANGELGFSERRLASAFRNPRDLAEWLLAGVSDWGVDPKFAPMRALCRADQLREWLSKAPMESGAGSVWVNSGRNRYRSVSAKSLMPSNAFTLMFKRRALPELAIGAVAAKGAYSLGTVAALGALTPAGPSWMVFCVCLGLVVKGLETGMSSNHRGGAAQKTKRELWLLRETMSSNWHIKRLARAALTRAKDLGYQSSIITKEVAEKNHQEANQLDKEAKRGFKEARALMKGGLLGALDQADKIQALKEQAAMAEQRAQSLRSIADQPRVYETGSIRSELNNFKGMVGLEAQRSLQLVALREKQVARVEKKELGEATRQPAPEKRAPDPKPARRI